MRARRGDRAALEQLFQRLGGSLRRWARGRLPHWARGTRDTEDIVQDVLIHALSRLEEFEPRRQKALQSYLREAVRNRIRDEMRAVGRRGMAYDVDEVEVAAPESLLDQVIEQDNLERYRRGLGRLDPEDRDLIVGRLELGYSYDQIALITGRATPDAARMALRRALLRLAQEMQA